MKMKQLSALAGLAGTALIAAPADAAFTGFTIQAFDVGVDHFNAAVRGAWNGGGGAGLESWRIYANFDGSGDSVNALFGDAGRRAFLSVSGTIFNNVETHSTQPDVLYNTPFFAGGFGANPERGWDTWVSVGLENADSGTALTAGFGAQTNNLGSNWDSDIDGNLSWFVTPTPAQSIVGASFQLLVMQLTVSAGSTVSGNFGIQVDSGAGGVNIHDDVGEGGISFFSNNVIPSPGAFALLGLAGLTGIRRRRRS